MNADVIEVHGQAQGLEGRSAVFDQTGAPEGQSGVRVHAGEHRHVHVYVAGEDLAAGELRAAELGFLDSAKVLGVVAVTSVNVGAELQERGVRVNASQR